MLNQARERSTRFERCRPIAIASAVKETGASPSAKAWTASRKRWRDSTDSLSPGTGIRIVTRPTRVPVHEAPCIRRDQGEPAEHLDQGRAAGAAGAGDDVAGRG